MIKSGSVIIFNARALKGSLSSGNLVISVSESFGLDGDCGSSQVSAGYLECEGLTLGSQNPLSKFIKKIVSYLTRKNKTRMVFRMMKMKRDWRTDAEMP